MPILFIVLITTALYYLGSRALITSWLWSRYPQRLARFMDCAACTGFWYGLGVTLVLGSSVPFDVPTWGVPIIVGLCSMVWTPLVAALMQIALERLGSVVPPDAEEVFEIGQPVPIKDIKVERANVGDPPVPIRDRKAVVLPTVFAENPKAALEFKTELSAVIFCQRSCASDGLHDSACPHRDMICACHTQAA